jgi:pyroglutamyl-peptidase
MRLIVTGFERFADFTYNPSQLAVEMLPDEISLANGDDLVRVNKLVFKGNSQDPWKELSSVLKQTEGSPTVVILTGLAGTRDRICLERFALNIRDFRIPDNSGNQPQDEQIAAGGPEGLRTRLPLPRISQHLNNCGYHCAVSNHAGTFLCNEIYYQSLLSGELRGHPHVSLFVHLPLPEYYGAGEEGGSGKASELTQEQTEAVIALYSAALAEIGDFACTWLSDELKTRTALLEGL